VSGPRAGKRRCPAATLAARRAARKESRSWPAPGGPGQAPATVLPVPWRGRYRVILTAPARLDAVVVIEVATADQLQESVAQTWIGSFFARRARDRMSNARQLPGVGGRVHA